MTCVICEKRPAVNGTGHCANCEAKLAAERRRNSPKAFRYATYQGQTIMFFHDGGALNYKLVQRNPEKLPKDVTIDLNHWCEGYTREQVKKIKAAILSAPGV